MYGARCTVHGHYFISLLYEVTAIIGLNISEKWNNPIYIKIGDRTPYTINRVPKKIIMLKNILPFFLLCFTFLQSTAQTNDMKNETPLPYQAIPTAPETYTAGAVAARTVDGLGYRYYWATEGLTDKELDYLPGNDGRSARETLEHLYGLSNMICNATQQKPNIRPSTDTLSDFAAQRAATLRNLQTASQILRESSDEDIANYKIIFQRGEQSSTFPFWNLLNGPLADALTHVGQIVSYRRSAGMPQSLKVNVFMGKNRQ